jgi:hypothetical protein
LLLAGLLSMACPVSQTQACGSYMWVRDRNVERITSDVGTSKDEESDKMPPREGDRRGETAEYRMEDMTFKYNPKFTPYMDGDYNP